MSSSLETVRNLRRSRLNQVRQPSVHRTFVVATPQFRFQPCDLVQIYNIPPRPGQYVVVDLPAGGPEIAVYRTRYLELSNGVQVVGLMDSIIGVVL
jgi:hypothetical protein